MYNKLNFEENRVINFKGTEAPFSGEYDSLFAPGTFICRRCNNPLYSAQAKFDAGCGWPAFDAVSYTHLDVYKRQPSTILISSFAK